MDGVANVAKNYAYWLNKKYGRSMLITPSFPGYKDDETFEVLRYTSMPLPKRAPYRLGLASLDFQVHSKLAKIPFDILHAHSPFSSGQLALRISKKNNIPIIGTFHSKYYDDFKKHLKYDFIVNILIKKIVKFYESMDAVWSLNKSTAKTLKSYGYQGSIDIMENGTDFDHISDTTQMRTFINENWHLSPRERVFLFVGQHIWQKNLSMLIKSLQILKKQGLQFKMLFVGDGYAKPKMEAIVKDMKLDDYVLFLGLITDRELLKALYARADLFLFPSVYDNAPIVLREAAALACPSLIIAGSNTAEGIVEGQNGFLSENDSEVYAKRIQKILSNPAKMKEVGKQAQKTIAVDWEKIVDKVFLKYKTILNTNK